MTDFRKIRENPEVPKVERLPFDSDKFTWACEVARIAHWLLNDRGYTRAMAATELARVARKIRPDLDSRILGDARPFVREIVWPDAPQSAPAADVASPLSDGGRS